MRPPPIYKLHTQRAAKVLSLLSWVFGGLQGINSDIVQMKTETGNKSQLQYLQNFINSVSKSQDCKQEIFNSFTRIDLQKIVCNFSNPDQKIRKLSLKFICLLLHANRKNKIDFCKLMDIAPSDGRIVLNSFPKSLLVRTEVPDLLKKLKQPIALDQDVFCLIYDITKERLMPIKKDSYAEYDFVDPVDYLVLIDTAPEPPVLSKQDSYEAIRSIKHS